MSEGGNLDEVAFPRRGGQRAPPQSLAATVVPNKTELPQHLAEMVFSGEHTAEEYLSHSHSQTMPALPLFKTVTTALTPPAP